MNLLKALQLVDKKDTRELYDLDKICSTFNVSSYDVESTKVYSRLKSYWLNSWSCTGEKVGTAALYLDDILVGMSKKFFRDDYEELLFVGATERTAVFQFVRSLEYKQEEDEDTLAFIDHEEEIDEWTSSYFANQLCYRGTLKGKVGNRTCEVVKIIRVPDSYFENLAVKFDDDGSIAVLTHGNIDSFKYRINVLGQ